MTKARSRPPRTDQPDRPQEVGARAPVFFNLIHRPKVGAPPEFRAFSDDGPPENGNPHPRQFGDNGDGDKGIGGIQDLPGRLGRLGEARHRVAPILHHVESVASANDGASVPTRKHGPVSPQRLYGQIAGCGKWLHFRHYTTIDQVRLHSAMFCKQYLLCPVCAIRRGSKMMQAVIPKFECVSADPELKAVLITFTVKNGPDLVERMEHLQSALRTVFERRRDIRKGKRGASQFGKVAGAFGSYEVTKSEHGWHPHVHMVALIEDWIDVEALSREWHSITGDSFVIDVRRLAKDQDPAEAFAEVCKYALKFSSMEAADTWQAFLDLKAVRLVFTLGNMRGVKIPDELTDEPLEGLPYVDWFYRFIWGKGYELDLEQTYRYREANPANVGTDANGEKGGDERAPT